MLIPTNLSSLYSGIRIFQSTLCVEKTKSPLRKHEKKRWMTDSYHRRVQKKWNKRYGFVMKPVMYQTPDGIFCHPVQYARIREALKANSSPMSVG